MVSIPVIGAPADPAAAATSALPGVTATPGANGEPLALDFSALLAALLGGATPAAPAEGGEATADGGETADAKDGTDDAPACASPADTTGATAAVAAAIVPAAVAPAPAPAVATPAPAASATAEVAAVDAATPAPVAATAADATAVATTAQGAAEEIADAKADADGTGKNGAKEGPSLDAPVAQQTAPAAAPETDAQSSNDRPPAKHVEPLPAVVEAKTDDATTTVQATRIAASPHAAAADTSRPVTSVEAPQHPATQVAAVDRTTATAPATPHAQTGNGESTPERKPEGKAAAQPAASDAPADLRDAAAPASNATPTRHADGPQPQPQQQAHATTSRDVPRDTSAAPQPAPHPARDVDQLVRLDAMRPLRVADGGEMRLEVHRPDLGQIDVRVTVRNDGVNATLLADQANAREALAAQRPSLEAALGRANLRLDGFSVGVGQQQHQSPQSDPQQQTAPAPNGWRPAPTAPATSVAAAEPVRTVTGGLSLRA